MRLRLESLREPSGEKRSCSLPVIGNIFHVQIVVRLVDSSGRGGRAGPGPLLLSLGSLLVSLDVFVEVIRPGESLPALLAGKPLLPCVSPEMALEFIRPGESFIAAFF